MKNQYHCFWVNPFGMDRQYKVFGDLEPVLDLVKENEKDADDFSRVRNLVVIYGERLDFEPAVVVQTFKVKEYDDE